MKYRARRPDLPVGKLNDSEDEEELKMKKKTKHRTVTQKLRFKKDGTSREITATELVQVSTKPTERNGHERNLSKVQHGAHALRRRYYAGLLDGRSKMGMWTRELERDFSQHLGYGSVDEMPPTMAMVVRSTIGNWLLLCTHHAGQEMHMFDLRAAENAVLRNCKELGLKPEPKSVANLHEYMKGAYGAKK